MDDGGIGKQFQEQVRGKHMVNMVNTCCHVNTAASGSRKKSPSEG